MGVARRGPRGRRKHNPIAWDYSAQLLDIRLAHAGLCLCPATPPTLSPARPGAASAFVAAAGAAGSGRPASIRPLHPFPPSRHTVQKIDLGRTARRRLGYDRGYVPAHGAREGRRRAGRRRRPRTPANGRPPPGKKAAAVLAGGSVDTRLLGRIVGRGLAEAGAS